MEWATANASTFMPAMAGSIAKAIDEYEREREKAGGAGTAWRPDVGLHGVESGGD